MTPWSCSAAAIREPDTGAILGVLDVTGGAEIAQPQTLALVRATVAAVEAELRLSRFEPLDARRHTSSGRERPRLEVLAEAVEGLTAAELAVGLSEEDQAEVTVRTELSRLRRQLGSVGSPRVQSGGCCDGSSPMCFADPSHLQAFRRRVVAEVTDRSWARARKSAG